MKRCLIICSLAYLFFLGGCGQTSAVSNEAQSLIPAPSSVSVPNKSKDQPPVPTQSTRGVQVVPDEIAPFFGVYGYSIEVLNSTTGVREQLSGCFEVFHATYGGLGFVELGDLRLSPGSGMEHDDIVWPDILEDDAITYASETGAEVTLKWSTNRSSIGFAIKNTMSGTDFYGTAQRVESPEDLREPEKRQLPQYKLSNQMEVRPFLGTFCYTRYRGMENMNWEGLGYLTVAVDNAGMMKLDGNGPFAIHRTGLLWQDVVEEGHVSFYFDETGASIVELHWSEDRTILTIIGYNLLSGNVGFLATAVRAA